MIGKTIDKYRIIKEIGQGGMGVVYLAEHTTLGKKYALKFLFAHFARNAELKERFIREAKAQASLKHPNIVGTVDYLEYEGDHIMVSEYIEGRNLSDFMKKHRKPLQPQAILKIMEGPLDALGYVHAKGIIHRDLKPSNILIDPNGLGHITDFGIALIMNMERITRTGIGMGTPLYMSPEQVSDPKNIDHRSDIYSFGCILYEMSTGEVPFIADTEYKIKYGHVEKTPRNVLELNPSLPVGFAAAIMKALAKNPNDRFFSCSEMLNTLRKGSAGYAPPKEKKNSRNQKKVAQQKQRKAQLHQQSSMVKKGKTTSTTLKIRRAGRRRIRRNIFYAVLVVLAVFFVFFIFQLLKNKSGPPSPAKEQPIESDTTQENYIDICDLKADWIRGPSYGMQGSAIDVGIQYTNLGKNATDVMTYYYLSSDPRYDKGDFFLDKYGPFTRIDSGRTIYHSYGIPINIPAGAPPGTWHLLYTVKSGNYNLTDTNPENDFTGYYPLVIRPAMKRCRIWIPNWHCEGPPHDTKYVSAGKTYKFHREVRNEGPNSCSELVLKYYWSEDGIVDGSDKFLEEEIISLKITNNWNFVNLSIPSNAVPGRKYWIGFTVNPKDCQLEQFEQEKPYSAWEVGIQ